MKLAAQVLILPLLCLSLAACEQTGTDLQHAHARAQAEFGLSEAFAAQHLAQRPTVQFAEHFYAPPVLGSDIAKPDWYSAPAKVDLRGFPLQQALHELLAPHGLGVRFLDDIDPQQQIALAHSGSLGQALERIARDTGYSYAVEDTLVTWSKFKVAEFDVAFLAGNTNFFLGDSGEQQNNASNGRGSALTEVSGGTPGNQQFLNFSSEALSVWTDLEVALKLLLSNSGQLAINQSSTSVLVRDYPQYVDQVEQYLRQQNQRLTRQVAVDVKVLEITFNDQDQTSVDWQLIRQASGVEGMMSMAGQLLNGDSSAGLGQLSLSRPQGRYAGSGVLLEALQQQGLVQVSNHPRVLSLNNQIAKIALQDNATYLASAGTTNTANVGSSDVLIPGVISTGFELYVLPKVSGQSVILQLSTSLSDLQSIDEVRSGDMIIQTPHTNRKNFFMKAMVANGNTLLLSGLKNSRSERREQSSFGSWLFGGGLADGVSQSETILLITPYIIEGSGVGPSFGAPS